MDILSHLHSRQPTMRTVYQVSSLLFMAVVTNCSPLIDLPSLANAAVKRDPTPSYGYKDNDKPAPWRTAWMKTLQKQSGPQYNLIPQETKIPAWVNPWTSQPVESLSTPIKRDVMNYRFSLIKNENNLVDKKRAYNPSQWFRFNPDVDVKRARHQMMGLNSVPMMGKRLYRPCQDCE